jgi:hypothetical protein
LTLAQLHNVIQLVMGWMDEHLTPVHHSWQAFGEAREGVLQFSTVANELALMAFGLREHEGLVYVYDFNAWWRHDIRVERRLLRQQPAPLPHCVAGCAACPPEDIGGIEEYLESKEERSEYEFLEWIESLREGPIVPDELRDEVELDAVQRARAALQGELEAERQAHAAAQTRHDASARSRHSSGNCRSCVPNSRRR